MDSIVKAIALVRTNAVKLTKASFNPHGRYNYVPIDTYYQQIVPLASEAGLIWRCRETGWELVTFNIKNEDKSYVRATYVFDLYMAGGETVTDFFTTTVCSPFTGPQTAGQMFSYADKVFMRVTFSVATGESDGDDLAPAEDAAPHTPTHRATHDPVTGEFLKLAPPAPTPAPADVVETRIPDPVVGIAGAPRQTKEGDPLVDTRTIEQGADVRSIIEIFRTWMPKVPSVPRLHDWYAENLAAVEKVGKIDPAARTEIMALFKSRKEQLDPKKEKAND